MRSTLITVFCLACLFQLQAQSKNIQFISDAQEAIKAIKDTKKTIFIDLYVEGCEPCATMKKREYIGVADYYNKNFLNISLDANGAGKELAQRFNISNFPSLLFLTEKGDYKYSVRGYRKTKALKTIGKLASLSKKNIKKEMRNLYKKYKDNPKFLYDYIEYIYGMGDYSGAEKMLKRYLNNKSKVDSSQWMSLVMDYGVEPDSPCNREIKKDMKAFIRFFGEDAVKTLLVNSFVEEALWNTGYGQFTTLEKKVRKEAEKAGFKEADPILVLTLADYLFYEQDLKSLRKHKSRYGRQVMEKHVTMASTELIKDIIIHTMKHVDDKEILASVAKGLKKLILVSGSCINYDYLSLVQYKMDKKDESFASVAKANACAVDKGQTFKSSLPEFRKLGYIK